MSLQTKVIGRQPTDHGPYNPNKSYGKKFCVTLFGCMWESLHDNNNTAPAVWDGGDTITPNLVDWKKVSGSYEAWLMNHDKPATSEQYPFNGMGRVTLQKNLVEVEEGGETVTKNLLTQAMFEDGDGNPLTDTVFIIQYDFTLGEDITVPANCVLEFDGGSISGNNTITLSGTYIKGVAKCLSNTILQGICSNSIFETDWFDIDKTGNILCTSSIQSAFSVSCPEVHFGEGIYAFNAVSVSHSCIVSGGGRGKTILKAQCRQSENAAGDSLLFFSNVSYAEIRDLQITCVDNREMPSTTGFINLPALRFDTMEKVVVDKVFYNQFNRKKVPLGDSHPDWEYNSTVALILCDDVGQISITNSEFYDSYGGENIFIIYTEKNKEDINLSFRNNLINTSTTGNSALSAFCNRIVLENNIVDNWSIHVSIFNLFANDIYINNNYVKNSDTLSVFDCCEYTEESNNNVICTNNIVECMSSIMLIVRDTKYLVVEANNHKGISLVALSNSETAVSDRREIFIENNKVDSTYYDAEYISGIERRPWLSAISLNNTYYLYCDTVIKGNYIKHITDKTNVNTYSTDAWRAVAPTKVYHNYGTLIIEDNTFEGVFPKSLNSSTYKRVIGVNVLSADENLNYVVGNITINDNTVIETGGASVSNSMIVEFANVHSSINKVGPKILNVLGNTFNGLAHDYIKAINVVADLVKGDYVLTNGFPIYEIEGYLVNTDTLSAYIRTGKDFRSRTYHLTAMNVTCIPNKDSVSDLGALINEGDVLAVGTKNFQCLKKVTELTQNIVDALTAAISTTSEGDIIQNDGFGGSWRRCIDRRNTVIDMIIPKSGTARPTLNSTYHVGTVFLDTNASVGKPIWWNGTSWVDATGTPV